MTDPERGGASPCPPERHFGGIGVEGQLRDGAAESPLQGEGGHRVRREQRDTAVAVAGEMLDRDAGAVAMIGLHDVGAEIRRQPERRRLDDHDGDREVADLLPTEGLRCGGDGRSEQEAVDARLQHSSELRALLGARGQRGADDEAIPRRAGGLAGAPDHAGEVPSGVGHDQAQRAPRRSAFGKEPGALPAGHGPAADATDEPLARERVQIPTDGHLRESPGLCEGGDLDLAAPRDLAE